MDLQNILNPAARCAILRIEKGKPQKRPTLEQFKLNVFQHQPSAIRSSWRLFSFVLEYLITQTDKGNNKYTKLNQVRICNIHWQALLSFVWRVSPSENQRVSRPALWFPVFLFYHSAVISSISFLRPDVILLSLAVPQESFFYIPENPFSA